MTFAGCNFGSISRMGVELIGDDAGAAAVPRYAFRDCSFEADGGEVISYCFNLGAYGLVSGCTFKGWGTS